MPVRIQRQRTKGWRMPEGAIYVGRPTIWGNPFRAGEQWPYGGGFAGPPMTAVDVVYAYRRFAREAGDLWWGPLRGHDLACWCPLDQPCHADVLLELANRPVDA